MDAKYIDPPLGRSVTSEEVAEKTRQMNASPRLDNPRDLSTWFPERPYMASNNYLREVDYPFITSRSTPDSYLCGEKMVEVLEQGPTRWGW